MDQIKPTLHDAKPGSPFDLARCFVGPSLGLFGFALIALFSVHEITKKRNSTSFPVVFKILQSRLTSIFAADGGNSH